MDVEEDLRGINTNEKYINKLKFKKEKKALKMKLTNKVIGKQCGNITLN